MIKVGEIYVESCTFHAFKEPICINNVNIEKILISNNIF